MSLEKNQDEPSLYHLPVNNEFPRSGGSRTINSIATPVMGNSSEQLTDYDKLIASRYQLVASGSAFADYDSFTDVVVGIDIGEID